MSWWNSCCPCLKQNNTDVASEQLIKNDEQQDQPRDHERDAINNENLQVNVYQNDSVILSNIRERDYVSINNSLNQLSSELRKISNFLDVPEIEKPGVTTNTKGKNEEIQRIPDINLNNKGKNKDIDRSIDLERIREIKNVIIGEVKKLFEDNEIVRRVENIFNITDSNVNIRTGDEEEGTSVQQTPRPSRGINYMREYLNRNNIPTNGNDERIVVNTFRKEVIDSNGLNEDVSEEDYRNLVSCFHISDYDEEEIQEEEEQSTQPKQVSCDAAVDILYREYQERFGRELKPGKVTKSRPMSPDTALIEFEELYPDFKQFINQLKPMIKKARKTEFEMKKDVDDREQNNDQQSHVESMQTEMLKVKFEKAIEDLEKEKLKQKEEAASRTKTLNDIILRKVQDTIRSEMINLQSEFKTQQEVTSNIQNKFEEFASISETSSKKQNDDFSQNIQETKEFINKKTTSIMESLSTLQNELGPLLEQTKKEITEAAEKMREQQSKEMNDKIKEHQEAIVNETKNKIDNFRTSFMNSIPVLVNAAASAGDSQHVFEEQLQNDFIKIDDKVKLRQIYPDVINYLSRLKRSRGNLPPFAIELEVTFQDIYCFVKLGFNPDISDKVKEAETAIEDCIALKPNEPQCERFKKLFPHGVLVAVEQTKPMKKDEAVHMWILWAKFCRNLNHIPEYMGLSLIRVLDRITEFATILVKEEGEEISGKLVERCVEESINLNKSLLNLYEENKDSYKLTDNYLAGLIRMARCMAFVGKTTKANQYLDQLIDVKDGATALNDDAKQEWGNRVEYEREQFGKA